MKVGIRLFVRPSLGARLDDRLPICDEQVRDRLRFPAVEQFDDGSEGGLHAVLRYIPGRRLLALGFCLFDQHSGVWWLDAAVPRTPREFVQQPRYADRRPLAQLSV